MGYVSRAISRVGGRRVLLALGGLYVAVAVGFPVLHVAGDAQPGYDRIITILVGGSGLALSYGGYRLPQTTIRPDLYHVITSWCVRAIEGMLAILLLVEIVAGLNDIVANVLILTSLASVAGLGMGIHDGRAKTRALDAEEYSQELERYQTIVETVNDGIFILDEDGQFALVNDAYTELVGYDREELLGSPASLVAARETNVDRMTEEIRRDLTEETAATESYGSTIRTASGETRDVESTVALLPEQENASYDTVVVVRDVTERNERERELERQNEQLDSFASLLAHELRNPVNIGQVYTQELPREESPKAVDYVAEAFDRIEDTIDVMLFVTRGREVVTEHSSVQLTTTAREVWTEVDAPEATLEVTTDLTIEADETYTHHLLRNLFDNAVEHGGADVTVTVGNLPTGFYVADDGRGIETDERETVFETGYTSAAREGGMGLGLTFVQEMADVYEWECSVTEDETGGARFEFENVTRTQTVTD